VISNFTKGRRVHYSEKIVDPVIDLVLEEPLKSRFLKETIDDLF
jgi:hypothetical protein